MRIKMLAAGLIAAMAFSSCSGGSSKGADFSGSADTPYTIRDERDLIGGPVAQGRVGDILLKNDKIRVIIQKPKKNPGVNSFGGNIIDADIIRSDGTPGQDNFGSIFPLINVEWTVNYRSIEAISDGTNGAQAVRARGTIDAYDYLDLSFLPNVSEGVVGQKISYSNRFDDRRNPFAIYKDLNGLSTDVVTDYTLALGASSVKIETTITNNGDEDAKFPVGQFMSGSGELSMLIPGIGFTPDLMSQVGGSTPAVIYAAFDSSDVSYGYFFPAAQFMDPKKSEPYTTTSVSYSGATGLLFGEEFLKLTPLGMGGAPEIHFSVPAGKSRTITGYFVVGNGSAGSVMDAGLLAIGALARPVGGTVKGADGRPVANATVAILTKGQTLVTYRTDAGGKFSGNLPTGGDAESKRFGSGKYSVAVDVPGFHKNQTTGAGECVPAEIDLSTKPSEQVECTLGETGNVELSGPVMAGDTGKVVAARLTIVGEDPSPNKVGVAGRFRSTADWDAPFGVVDVKYITALGTLDLSGETGFNLEPGTYRFVISHGSEYAAEERVLDVPAGDTLKLEAVKLARAVTTPGLISSDFHVHSIRSADSTISQELRVLSAAAEGLDVLQSSDHDYITDYAPIVSKLMSEGLIPQGSMKSASGDEVTPNHYGHVHMFPVLADPNDPDGGALDWSDSDREEISPAPDYNLTLDQLIKKLRAMNPGDEVIQVNHILDNPTGILLATGWVTTAFYAKDFGVLPLSSYADPVERRMTPRSDGGTSFPIPLGASGLVSTDFDSVELAIGPHMHDGSLFYRTALPTWFNLLNLGLTPTATADSDSHIVRVEPIGMPRNYIVSSVDPSDGKGSDHSAINLDEYTASIKAHKVTVSAGPFVMMSAKADGGASADIGGTITGKHVTITIDVQAPSWGWFDTIEVFANTEPIPADDKTDLPMQGIAADPAKFYMPYHVPRYIFEATKSFRLSDGSLKEWKEESGRITATVTFDMDVTEDTWVVAMARGTRDTKGYRSLFPLVTDALIDPKSVPDTFDPANLAAFHVDKKVGAPGWGMTNPIFIDADGDGFKAKYVREGISPIK